MLYITLHMKDRIAQRAGAQALKNAESELARAWRSGRVADETDFLMYRAIRRPGVAYRVVSVWRQQWMLARCVETGNWITIFGER